MESSFSADVVPQAPADPLFGLMAQYKEDQSPKKVDLGIGAYRDDNAKPVVLVRSILPATSLWNAPVDGAVEYSKEGR